MRPMNAASSKQSAKKVTKQNLIRSKETSLSNSWTDTNGEAYDGSTSMKVGQKADYLLSPIWAVMMGSFTVEYSFNIGEFLAIFLRGRAITE